MLHYSSWDRGAHQLNFQTACYSLQLQALHHENFFLCFCVLEPGVRCYVLLIPWWGMDRFKIVQRCDLTLFTHKPQIVLIAYEPKPQPGRNPGVHARIRCDHESPVFPPNMDLISKSTTGVGLSRQLALASCPATLQWKMSKMSSWNERYVCMNNAWAIAKLILSPVFDAHLNRLEPWTYSNYKSWPTQVIYQTRRGNIKRIGLNNSHG